ncbi:MAG: cystathionine gamma-synthase [Aggregatilineales bacterium]|mgnify:FL=1|nr:cystathionine gamma-synthase [Chloroflexota bacterium]HOA22914.1 cystathionine gamma-synthase [Aggregatilineales bacterium]HPV06647.1 cystathionine gamma-synthase [Aggregatilineales bacterium]HQE17193.1 cystathionine gamma-synthase [Aggregatilineales bacterium]
MKTQPTDHLDTLAVHAGQEPDPTTGAIMTPIYQTSTYVQSAPGEHKGYEYSRTDNPTRTALQANIAALEGGAYGLAFASGLAATDTLLRLYGPGDHVIVGNDVYGGTYRLFEQVLRRYGLEFSYVDVTDPAAVASAIRPETRLIWLETPTNPLLAIADIEDIARRARGSIAGEHIRIAVDNTFASPYLQQPLRLGADIVVHSTTKYLGGHSDVVGGAIVTNDAEVYERLKFLQNAVGAVPGPLDCWLTLRGIKTLHLRMARHSENAQAVAEYLEAHPKVERVYYPGLESHPQHELARKQMRAPGGMVSIIMRDGEEAARQFVQRTRLFALAESLGGVESLIEHPYSMTHASTASSEIAVPPGLVRLSVGVEHIDDLLADLEQALAG